MQTRRSRRGGAVAAAIPKHCWHGFCAKQGNREYMEDRCCCLTPLPGVSNADCCLFGVYDGHGGDEAAEFCSKNIAQFLVRNSKFRKNPQDALVKAYEKADKKFCAIATKKDIGAGTTAVTALVFADKIIIANTGDSRAIMVRRGGASAITEDHNPGLPRETERIKALGGSVVDDEGCFRVEGVLGVSRAIGDHYLKPYVTCAPDIYELKRTQDDLFLVMASDGLWEDLVANDCMSILKQELQNGKTLETSATAMVDLALKRGSDDNICVVVVDLRDPKTKGNDGFQPNNTKKRKADAEASPTSSSEEGSALERTQSTAGRAVIAAKIQEHKQKRQRRSQRGSKKR